MAHIHVSETFPLDRALVCLSFLCPTVPGQHNFCLALKNCSGQVCAGWIISAWIMATSNQVWYLNVNLVLITLDSSVSTSLGAIQSWTVNFTVKPLITKLWAQIISENPQRLHYLWSIEVGRGKWLRMLWWDCRHTFPEFIIIKIKTNYNPFSQSYQKSILSL